MTLLTIFTEASLAPLLFGAVAITSLSIAGFKEQKRTQVPFYKNWFFILAFLAFAGVVGSLAWIDSENKPYDPKKHGVPTEQTDTTRQSVEDQIKAGQK